MRATGTEGRERRHCRTRSHFKARLIPAYCFLWPDTQLLASRIAALNCQPDSCSNPRSISFHLVLFLFPSAAVQAAHHVAVAQERYASS